MLSQRQQYLSIDYKKLPEAEQDGLVKQLEHFSQELHQQYLNQPKAASVEDIQKREAIWQEMESIDDKISEILHFKSEQAEEEHVKAVVADRESDPETYQDIMKNPRYAPAIKRLGLFPLNDNAEHKDNAPPKSNTSSKHDVNSSNVVKK